MFESEMKGVCLKKSVAIAPREQAIVGAALSKAAEGKESHPSHQCINRMDREFDRHRRGKNG